MFLGKDNVFPTLDIILAISACLDFYLLKVKVNLKKYTKKTPNNILNKKQHLSGTTPKKYS